MFSLAERDLAKRILDCASGPASFNAEAHKLNQGHVVSVDPLYEFSRQEMTTLVENARSQIMPQIRANQT